MDRVIQLLADRDEIDNVLSTYCRGIDRHDVDLINAAYFDDAHDNHGPFQRQISDGFAEWGNKIHAERTQAHLHNRTTKVVEVNGNTAKSDTYVIFSLFLRADEQVLLGFGRYLDELERRDGAWRIARRQTTIDMRMVADGSSFTALNAGSPLASSGYPVGTWDRNDLSYDYPFELPPYLKSELERKGPRPDQELAPQPHPFEDHGLSGKALRDRLFARTQIADVVANSVRGLDRQIPMLSTGAFTSNATVRTVQDAIPISDYVSREIDTASREDLVQARNITTQSLRFVDSGAVMESYVIEMRRCANGRDVWLGGIRMLDRLVPTDSGWLIADRTIIRDWETLSHNAQFDPNDRYLRSMRGVPDCFAVDASDQLSAAVS